MRRTIHPARPRRVAVAARLAVAPAAALTLAACHLAVPADVPGDDIDAAPGVIIDSAPGAPFDSPPEPGIDSAPGTPDAKLSGIVTVTVKDWGGVLPGNAVPVVFSKPDGTVITTVTANAMGKAQADVLPGTNVSVVYVHTPTTSDAVTVVGVKPGDDLVITPNLDHTAAGSFTVTHPTFSGSFVKVYGPCGLAPGNGNVFTVTNDCLTNPMTVYVTASHTNGLDGYMEKKNVTFVDGGSTDVPGPWPSMAGRNISYTKLPPEVDNLVTYWYPTDNNSIGPDGATVGSATPANQQATVTAPEPNTTNAYIKTVLGTTIDQQSGDRDYRTVIQRVAGNTVSFNIDMSARVLAEVETPGFSVATGTFSAGGDATGADLWTAVAHYQRSAGGKLSKDVYWRVMAAAPGPVTLPKLAGAIADTAPMTGDAVLNTNATLIDVDSVFGYDDARLHPYDVARAPGSRFGATTNQIRWSDSPP